MDYLLNVSLLLFKISLSTLFIEYCTIVNRDPNIVRKNGEIYRFLCPPVGRIHY